MISKTSLPSKKIIVLLLCAFLLLSTIIFKKYFSSSSVVSNNPTSLTNNTISSLAKVDTLDSDGDDLPDWQEIILGTNPNKVDTDEDGTLDGKEIELSRDPKISGPDDRTNGSIQSTKTTEDTTISENVAKNLFANTLFLNNNDQVTVDNTANLVDNLVTGIGQSFTYTEYSGDGLRTISNENNETISFYASSFATLQINMALQMQKNIIGIESNLSILARIYAKQAKDLYALQVPAELKEDHLNVVNNYSKISTVYEAIANEKKDPLKLPFAMRTYQQVLIEQPINLKNISQFIAKNDIIFSSNEAGAYWNVFNQN